MENIEKKLGSVVKSLRQAAGMTQGNLAQQLTAEGLPTRQNTVAKLEGGLRPTTVTEFGALARIFNHSVAQFADAVFAEGSEEEEAAKNAMIAELTYLQARISELRNRHAMQAQEMALTQLELRESEMRAALLESRIGGRQSVGDDNGEHSEEG